VRGDKFIIRPYRRGDEFAINEMFNEVFHQNRQIEHWYWKYRDNPYGSYKITLAFAPDGTLAAHYGGYPVRLFYYPDNGSYEEYTSLHLGDKMTRKRFRAVGFGRNSILAKTFRGFQDTFLRDVLFGYGFAAHHSLRFGLLFLGYVDVEPVPFKSASVDELRTNLNKGLMSRFNILKTRQVETVDERWSAFFFRVAQSYKFLTKRDEEYLRWRYFKRPDRSYIFLSVSMMGRLKGWSVFYRDGDRIIWGDALFEPRDLNSVRSILSYLLKEPFSAGTRSIEGWFPSRPFWWEEVLSSLGFENHQEPSNLHLISPVNDGIAISMLKDFYYTIGDSDLF